MTMRIARVLLVDDDPDIRASVGQALDSAGYDVHEAANGHQALAHLLEANTVPDVILLDLLMPVMNGWQFCEAKRAVPAAVDIPVIAMSAAVSRDPASPYYLEVSDFVAKPLDLDDLLSKLSSVISGHKGGVSL